jgi:hypothetical protein
MKKLVALAAVGLVSLVTAGTAWAAPGKDVPPKVAVDHACGRRVDAHPPFCSTEPR